MLRRACNWSWANERVRAGPACLWCRQTPSHRGATAEATEVPMLWTLIVVLVVLWALGLIGSIGGAFIHLLLVLALILLVIQLLSGRRAV